MPEPIGGVKAVVWTRENRFSSNGKTKIDALQGLPGGATEMCGEYICVTEESRKGKKLVCAAFGNDDEPGQPCFAQKFAYATLDRFLRFLTGKLDLDLPQVAAALARRKMAFPVKVNEWNLVNAYFNPGDGELVFGDGEGKLSLATDGDIVIHEASHWMIDLINPQLGQAWHNIGRAIHEGSADAITAMFWNDPQMAEDFNQYTNGRGYKNGLRSVQNTRTMANIGSTEEHEVGKVIGGFWWSLCERLVALLKSRNAIAFGKNPEYYGKLARHATIKLVLAHAGSYAVPSPRGTDFLEAVARGATDLTFVDELPELVKNGVYLASLLEAIAAEGKKRGLDVEPAPPPARDDAVSSKGIPLGEAIAMIGAAGDSVRYRPQLYALQSGAAEVTGYGTIEREGQTSTRGLRAIAPGSVDETILVSRGEAYDAATRAAGKELPALLAARTGDAFIAPPTRLAILQKVRAALEANHASGAKLAILPDATGISWLLDAGPAAFAVDAKTGKVRVLFKGMVD